MKDLCKGEQDESSKYLHYIASNLVGQPCGIVTQDYDGGYDEPYVEREHKLQPQLSHRLSCHG